MAYSKNTWSKGDVITSSKLNNIESGIQNVENSIPTKVSELSNDKGYLTSIPTDYVTETELTAKGYLTEHQDISGLASKDELHSHTNKTVLDGITSAKVSSWDGKSDFSGSYNDLTNKPTIPTVPTKVSDLSNDSGFISEVPSEYITEEELEAKGYLTEHQDISSLTTQVNTNKTNITTLQKLNPYSFRPVCLALRMGGTVSAGGTLSITSGNTSYINLTNTYGGGSSTIYKFNNYGAYMGILPPRYIYDIIDKSGDVDTSNLRITNLVGSEDSPSFTISNAGSTDVELPDYAGKDVIIVVFWMPGGCYTTS